MSRPIRGSVPPAGVDDQQASIQRGPHAGESHGGPPLGPVPFRRLVIVGGGSVSG